MTSSPVANRQVSTKKALWLIRRFAIPCVSGLIAFIWSVQFMVSVPLCLVVHDVRRSWPMVDYPMYSMPHFEGDKIPHMAIVGIRGNGEEINILPEDVGGGYWHFQIFARALIRGDEDVIQDMVRMYEAHHNVRLAALRVENRPLLWKSAQVKAAPVEILRTYPLNSVQHNSKTP